MATASYESGAVRKMVGLRGSVWGGNARDRRVFWPLRSLRTDLACIRFLPRLQEVRTIYKTRNQFHPSAPPITAHTAMTRISIRRCRLLGAWGQLGSVNLAKCSCNDEVASIPMQSSPGVHKASGGKRFDHLKPTVSLLLTPITFRNVLLFKWLRVLPISLTGHCLRTSCFCRIEVDNFARVTEVSLV